MTAPTGIRDDLRRAEALLEVGRVADALAILTAVAAAAPDDATAHCLIARCHSVTGHHNQMLRAATDATLRAPALEWGHRLRATALRKLRRHREAVAAAETAVSLDADHWYTHAALAEALIAFPERRDRRRAYEHATIALRMAPEVSNTHITMGRVLQSIGERRAARAHFERAIALNPTDPAGHTNLAAIDLERGRILTAGRGLRDVAAANPAVPIHHDNVRVAAGRWCGWFVDIMILTGYVDVVVAWVVPAPWNAWACLAIVASVLGFAGAQFARMPPPMRVLAIRYARTGSDMGVLLRGLTLVFSLLIVVTLAKPHGRVDADIMLGLILVFAAMLSFPRRVWRYGASFALRRRYRAYVLGSEPALGAERPEKVD